MASTGEAIFTDKEGEGKSGGEILPTIVIMGSSAYSLAGDPAAPFLASGVLGHQMQVLFADFIRRLIARTPYVWYHAGFSAITTRLMDTRKS